ncbi:leucine-rich repeat-containing protein 71-like isoform X2 [Tubulanus polymorphus]
MGRKVERALKHTAASSLPDDEENRTPEPHVCNGNFTTDFTELSRRRGLIVIPPVVTRPRRPPSPSMIPTMDAKESSKKGRGGDDKNKQPEPEPEPELDENGEPPEPPPRTYVMKDKFEYFKPCVQVEMDHPDKPDTVTEVFIRGWKIDDSMLDVFSQCFVTMERLHTLHFWSTGLTAESVKTIASFLPHCVNIRSLVLEGNPIEEENYWQLIAAESPLQNLSLRHNRITNKGAEQLGKQLGEVTRCNTKLITLNLNNNQISNDGAVHLANGLRINRTLLCLSLANNDIGDLGAQKLAEVLSRFPLTHDEVVERRKLVSEKGSPDIQQMSDTLQKSPPLTRRSDSKDRPGSVRSGIQDKKRDKSSSKKKDDKKDDKENKTKGKKDDKNSSKKGASSSGGRTSGASITLDPKASKAKEKKAGKDKGKTGTILAEVETLDISESVSPLLEPVENINGRLWIAGNRTLINLNLARNKIGEHGVKALLLAIQYQTTLLLVIQTAGTGLMRLCLHKNRCSADDVTMQKLTTLMETKDPFYKNTDGDSASQLSESSRK